MDKNVYIQTLKFSSEYFTWCIAASSSAKAISKKNKLDPLKIT